MDFKRVNKEKIERIEVERFNRPAKLNVDLDAISEEMKRAAGTLDGFFKRLEEEAAKYQHDMDMCIICEMALQWLKEQENGKTYTQGLADAWELARKIVGFSAEGAYSWKELEVIFGDYQCEAIFKNNTYEEALAKIEAYEKEKEIKVGDEVVLDGDKEKPCLLLHAFAEVLYPDSIRTEKHIHIFSQIGLSKRPASTSTLNHCFGR